MVFRLAEAAARRWGLRGCLYVDVATEFPERKHPVRLVVTGHREWLAGELTSALAQAGVRAPERLAARP
ncbi:MAG TPA: hypothetical protein VH008_34265 [Pseudonocardia sp.]|nr:hypothetical protein [Pseudonocardia sp.]